MNKRYFLGIDTSAYTTSLAVIDNRDKVILDLRKVLEVKKGQKGLRQQEAVFQHINNLPQLIEKMTKEIDISLIETISCSNKPRNIEESYMPVFLVGKGQAFILSKVLGTQYKEFSHQDGHIGAGIMYNNLKYSDRFLSLHISGGTTELLLVNNMEERLSIDIIGGTLDLSIGQLIDRIGLQLDLPFPSGKIMDEISQDGRILDHNIPVKIKEDRWFNLSGLENYFKKIIQSESYNIEDILATLFHTMGTFIYKVIVNSCFEYQVYDVVITGGVSANKQIRQYLSDYLNKDNINPFFPKIELCTDNGVGIAYMGKEK